jgi:hypothetical protein
MESHDDILGEVDKPKVEKPPGAELSKAKKYP